MLALLITIFEGSPYFDIISIAFFLRPEAFITGFTP